MSLARIALVDDEEDLREPVAGYLRRQGFDVVEAGGGAALDAAMAAGRFDCVVLDINMPEEDGFSIARRLRGADAAVGIVMLTTRNELIDRVVGLEIGADDYIGKPFEPRELVARIRAVLRRHAPPGEEIRDAAAAAAPVARPEPPAVSVEGDYHRAFWVQTGRGQIRVPIDAIEWIEAQKDYALLHTGERSHTIRVTMSALEGSLDPRDMLRVHRSAFVQPDAVRHISTVGRQTSLILASGAAVRVGPRHVKEVLAALRR